MARAVSGKYPTELFFSADQTGYTSGRFCLVETACPRVLAHDGLQRFPYRFSLHVLSKLDTEKYSQFFVRITSECILADFLFVAVILQWMGKNKA